MKGAAELLEDVSLRYRLLLAGDKVDDYSFELMGIEQFVAFPCFFLLKWLDCFGKFESEAFAEDGEGVALEKIEHLTAKRRHNAFVVL